jgi:hypothetical protein
MNEKIIFITDSEFTKRDFDRFGISLMLNAGIEVHVFDLSAIQFPKLKRGRTYEFNGLHQIISYKQFKDIFKSINGHGLCFVFISLTIRFLPYFIQIWKSSFELGTLRAGILPAVQMSKWIRLKRSLKAFFLAPVSVFREIEIFALRKIFKVLSIRRDPQVYFCAGRKAKKVPTGAQVVPVGSFDFNSFLSAPSATNNNFILFLDEYEPFHPDFERLGIPKVNPEHYFKALNIFFERLEKSYNLPVVIAAHPRAEIETYSFHFGGRKVVQGETARLISESSAVVAHTSTAVQLIFLYKKKFCFVLTEEMLEGYRKEFFAMYTKYGFHFLNLDAKYEVNTTLGWDEDLATRYVDDYVIEQGVRRQNSWLTVIDYLKSKDKDYANS